MGRQRKTPGLYQRGEVWHMDKQVQGGRLRGSTHTTDRKEAERFLAMKLEEHRKMMLYGERPAVTFGEAAVKYMEENCPAASAARIASSLKQTLPYVEHVDIRLLHDGSFNQYREDRRAAEISAGTINYDLGIVTRILNKAARTWRHPNGLPYLDTPPLLQQEKGAKRKPYPLSWDEQTRIFAHLSERTAEVALFFVNTGVRSGELIALRWEWRVQVPELDTYVFVLPESATKTGKERVLVLNDTAKSIIDRRAERMEHPELVFVDGDGKPWYKGWTWWVKARTAAKVPARLHDLRHTFGQRLRAAGVDVETRADLLGHEAGRMTTHYSAPDLRRLIEAANKIVTARPSTILRAVQ